MEAQRYPDDFDGIVSGAPGVRLPATEHHARVDGSAIFADNFAGNLAFDKDGDGTLESLTKLRILQQAVLAKCDANDGIQDGVIDDPPSCRFDPFVDLEPRTCPAGKNGDECFTQRQLQTLQEIYRGPHDSRGVRIYKGMDFGSEWDWQRTMFPHHANGMVPAKLIYGVDHVNFLFYEKSPGVPLPNPFNPRQIPDKRANPPEFGWWEFNIDDVTSGRGAAMMAITDATDPDLSRYLLRKNGKLLMFHGWADPEGQAEPTLDYYRKVIENNVPGRCRRSAGEGPIVHVSRNGPLWRRPRMQRG